MNLYGRSIRTKVMVIAAATAGAALLLAGLALFLYDTFTYRQTWAADNRAQAEIVARAGAPALAFEDREGLERTLALLQARPSVVAAGVYRGNGKLFARYLRSPNSNVLPERVMPMDLVTNRDGLVQLILPIREGKELYGSVVLLAMDEPAARVCAYLLILAVVLIGSMGLALVLSSVLRNAVTEPILEVVRAAKDVINRQDYDRRVEVETRDETADLARAFNQMLEVIGQRSRAVMESEASLREADRRKDEFLATLAHELRNPLAPIRNAVEMQKLRPADARLAEVAREMIERQLNQLSRLVDDLLDVSRVTRGKLALRRERIDLRDVVRDAVEMTRPVLQALSHQLTERGLEGNYPVDGDRTRLTQVVVNLLTNAAKYTSPGGSIAISLGREQSLVARILVEDNGIGIPPNMLESVFEMFVQVAKGEQRGQAGLGVGLTLAKQLVEMHGGNIRAVSEGANRGTRFVVQIPLATNSDTTGDASTLAIQRAPTMSKRILVVDDNRDAATSLGTVLSLEGHEVRIAYSGPEALDEVEEFEPDIAFLDIGMAEMTGYELAARLKEHPIAGRAFLIAMTGWGQQGDRERAAAAGFAFHLVKPASLEAVRSAIAMEHASPASPAV